MKVAVVGAGPWGMAIFERLIVHAVRNCDTSLSIDIYDPNPPGPGVHSPNLPKTIWLNTNYRQINGFSASTFNESGLQGSLSFEDWLKSAGEFDPEIIYYSRAVFGEYMRFVFDILLKNTPSNVSISYFPFVVESLGRKMESNLESITTDGIQRLYDQVIICTGHGVKEKTAQSVKGKNENQKKALYDNAGRIGVAGIGLDAVDKVIMLTEGRGGKFYEDEGVLKYNRSNCEPELYLYSRNGLPFCCRPDVSLDGLCGYKPVYCTEKAINDLRKIKGSVDFAVDVLPLLCQEVYSVYFYRFSKLQYACSGSYSLAVSAESTAGDMAPKIDPYSFFKSAKAMNFSCATQYASYFINRLSFDVRESCLGEEGSPYKAALEVFRMFRGFIRQCVEFNMLSPESERQFYDFFAPRINQICVGPPAVRGRQFLALIEAGIIKLDLGPDPEVINLGSGKLQASSTAYENNLVVTLDAVVNAHQNVEKKGRPMVRFGDEHSQDFEINRDLRVCLGGSERRNVTVVGIPTTGWTYFNNYFPSPNSRSQAFVIANNIAEGVFKQAKCGGA